MQEVKNVLDYWYKLEYFSPFYTNAKNKIQENDELPWNKGDDEKIYELYVGSINSESLIREMYTELSLNDDRIERDTSKNNLFAIRILSNGVILEESFKLSRFVWAMSKIIGDKDLNVKLEDGECKKLEQELVRNNIGKELTFEKLKDLQEVIMKSLNIKHCGDFEIKYFTINMSKNQKEEYKTSGTLTNAQYTKMMTSFYVEDLNMVREKILPSSSSCSYINAIRSGKHVKKFSVNNNAEEMNKWLQPDKYPLGKWPSKFWPSLMQQIGINISISDNDFDVFSVNGPPGTGKTTLLKEIIASNIVERAIKLSRFDKPDDAYVKQSLNESYDYGIDDYYYKLHNDVANYGIIVASNNNAAVENISKELPLLKSVQNSHTGLFENVGNIYHTKLSYDYNNPKNSDGKRETDIKTWGMISARLGNSKNRNEFLQMLRYDSESLFSQLKTINLGAWRETVSNFKKVLAEVELFRSKLIKEIQQMNTYDSELNKKKKLELELNDIMQEIASIKMKLSALESKLADKRKSSDDTKKTLNDIRRSINFIHRILHVIMKNNADIEKEKKYMNRLSKISDEIFEIEELVNSTSDNIHDMQLKGNKKNKNISIVSDLLDQLIMTINGLKSAYDSHFVDKEFWEDIESNRKSQLASPWTNEEYDTLREKLFYHALKLHESFVRNSEHFKHNVRVYAGRNGLSIKDQQKSFSDLLNSIQLFVPVISTTFASVGRFLEHAAEKSLGMLVIDEAGQATPQSAVGAIFRANKTIVVGDPIQVEPVTTVPKELIKRFRENYDVPYEYTFESTSVQTLSDSINPYGGYRRLNDSDQWLGCPLLIHRRCINPMFDIANAIAYDNKMYKETMEPKQSDFIFETSQWLNIAGSEIGDKNHFVLSQGQYIVELLTKELADATEYPDLFVISPFKSVINGVKELVKPILKAKFDKKATDILDTKFGTVHTFQGKEANEVILVLGCDNEQGFGAAKWAGKKPNILNVALTRAKYRVAVIGDVGLWSQIPYFSEAVECLTITMSDEVNELSETYGVD